MPVGLIILMVAIGVVLLVAFFYLIFNPRSMSVSGPNSDLRFVGFALLLIVMTSGTIGFWLVLGKADEIDLQNLLHVAFG